MWVHNIKKNMNKPVFVSLWIRLKITYPKHFHSFAQARKNCTRFTSTLYSSLTKNFILSGVLTLSHYWIQVLQPSLVLTCPGFSSSTVYIQTCGLHNSAPPAIKEHCNIVMNAKLRKVRRKSRNSLLFSATMQGFACGGFVLINVSRIISGPYLGQCQWQRNSQNVYKKFFV